MAGPVAVLAEHLAGDGQADRRGPDKAVYAYAQEHYAYWQPRLLESDVRVGDCFRVGTAVLLAVRPRRPCLKLGIRLQRPVMVREFEQARRPGIYFRVVAQGTIQAGDQLTLLPRPAHAVTIQDLINTCTPGFRDANLLRALLALPTLSASWRERLTQQLAAAQP